MCSKSFEMLKRKCRSPAIHQPCGFDNDRRGMSGGRDVSLTILIACTTGSKNLTYTAYHFFYFRRPPGLTLAFDVAEKNGKFGPIQCQRSKESSSKGKRGVFLCRRTVRVKVKGKSHLNKLSEN